MKGVGHVSHIWLTKALKAGLFPSTYAHTVATIIADAADADGRWCFLRQANLLSKCGESMSLPTLKRAIDAMVDAGLVRKLTEPQKKAFFAVSGPEGSEPKQCGRLPPVLELLVPAGEFSPEALEEINRRRAGLGEEPLTKESRPYPLGFTGLREPEFGSQGATDPYPTDPYKKPDPSVRGSSTTGRAREDSDGHDVGGGKGIEEPSGGALALLAHIPDAALGNPGPDRAALARALDRLREQGMEQRALVALVEDIRGLRRPFPALMSRMRSVEDARRFLDGRLGAGVHLPGRGVPPSEWGGIPMPRRGDLGFPSAEGDPFDRPVEFTVDSQGRASGTCPEHPGVRNVPGGSCAACGGPCRSVPGETLPSPVPAPAAPEPPQPRIPDPVPPVPGEKPEKPEEDGEAAAEETGEAEEPEEAGVEPDPELERAMRASLEQARARPAAPRRAREVVLTPKARAVVDAVRERLANARTPAASRAPASHGRNTAETHAEQQGGPSPPGV